MSITEKELGDKYLGYGLPEEVARMLAELDTHIKEGKEEITGDAILKVTGKEPRGLDQYLKECVEKGVWNKV